MSTISISGAFSDLFSAPLKAVVEAERDYLAVWQQRLKTIQAVYVEAGAFKEGASLEELIERYVPVVRLEGNINTALTMRIAGVRESSGKIDAGLSLGPIHASGGFGFVNRTTEESVFQATTNFVISNKEFSLKDYLKAAHLPVATPADLDGAIAHLGTELGTQKRIAEEGAGGDDE